MKIVTDPEAPLIFMAMIVAGATVPVLINFMMLVTLPPSFNPD
jgi:hypothetical protein